MSEIYERWQEFQHLEKDGRLLLLPFIEALMCLNTTQGTEEVGAHCFNIQS